jgi:isoquinoline 1-oxidoreductase subunit alpha
VSFTIKVNGAEHRVDADGESPLLWVLRDMLGMMGTKFDCGMALCGADDSTSGAEPWVNRVVEGST